MTRHIVTAAALLAVVGLLAGSALAQPAPGDRGPRQGDGPRPGEGDRGKMILDRLVKELELNAEKEAQLKTLFETYQQAMGNWMKEHGEEMRAAAQKMRDAKDDDARKEAREAVAKIDASRKELQENLMKQLGGVLDEKQLAKAKEIIQSAVGPRRPGEALMDALKKVEPKLTDEQWAKIKEIQDAAKAEAEKATERRERFRILEGVTEKVKAILTPEQKAKLEELLKAAPVGGPLRMYAALNLSDEQRKQVEAIMEKAQKAPPEGRREAWQEAMKEISEKVLTPEQRKKLEEMRAGGQRPGGEGRRQPGKEGEPKPGDAPKTP